MQREGLQRDVEILCPKCHRVPRSLILLRFTVANADLLVPNDKLSLAGVAMALYLITYDISEKRQEEYQPLYDGLERMEASRILQSVWVVASQAGDAIPIYEKLLALIRSSDRLLVQEVTRDVSWERLLVSDDDFRSVVLKNARGQ